MPVRALRRVPLGLQARQRSLHSTAQASAHHCQLSTVHCERSSVRIERARTHQVRRLVHAEALAQVAEHERTVLLELVVRRHRLPAHTRARARTRTPTRSPMLRARARTHARRHMKQTSAPPTPYALLTPVRPDNLHNHRSSPLLSSPLLPSPLPSAGLRMRLILVSPSRASPPLVHVLP